MLDDAMLEDLGNHFVSNNLVNKGWEFHEFIREWQLGTIVLGRTVREEKQGGN